MNGTEAGRFQRLAGGWSANVVQLFLGVVQQVALIPVFLHFWTTDVLAAWLAIYAAGNLILIADAGLQLRSINRFLAFKSTLDRDGRTGQFYAGMLRTYLAVVGGLGLLLLLGIELSPPSSVLKYQAGLRFDAAFAVMTVGTLLGMPSNLVSGLYRARGKYSRAVWFQCGAMLFSLIAQLMAIALTRSLLAVTIAYISGQICKSVYLLVVDAPRLFPFLCTTRARSRNWRWSAGQFYLAFPFAIATAIETALLNVPVLLVSALVSDRLAVAQWGLTRAIAGLVRMLCVQVTLPLAAELGQEYAVGRSEEVRHLYAQGSVFITFLGGLVVSGLLPYWRSFFLIWTHGNIPYNAPLTITVLVGTCFVAPSALALGFANYSNRGALLARIKGLQLLVFLVLAFALIPSLGPLGAAIAMIASDVLIQFNLLTLPILRQTLQNPMRHAAFLTALTVGTILLGSAVGTAIGVLVPGNNVLHISFDYLLWMVAAELVASSLANRSFRKKFLEAIPE